MAGSGMIFGGLLSGIGKGMEMTALQARQDALEALRAKRDIETEQRQEQTLIGREDRLNNRVIAQEGRAEERAVAKDGRDYVADTGKLALAAEFKKKEGETEFQHKIRLKQLDVTADQNLERLRQSGDITLAQFNQAMDDASDARKAGELIADWKTLPSGQVVGVTATGRTIAPKVTRNGKTEALMERPSAAEVEADAATAADARREARRSGRAALTPEPVAKPKAKPEGKPVSEIDYNALYSQAAARAERGEAGYKGLDAAGIKAKVDGILRKNGYAI